jgi:hypothetical protein
MMGIAENVLHAQIKKHFRQTEEHQERVEAQLTQIRELLMAGLTPEQREAMFANRR